MTEHLSVPEQVVLLTLTAHASKAAEAIKFIAADLPDRSTSRHQVLDALRDRGLVEHHITSRHSYTGSPRALFQAQQDLRRAVNLVGPISAEDAVLLVFVAYAGGLAHLAKGERLRARHRVASIGHEGPIPRSVQALVDRMGALTMQDFADSLLLRLEQATPPEPTLTGVYGPWSNIR